MPIVSMFFGIVIRMFYNDHDPPHFHADYQGQRGKFDLDGNMTEGNVHSRTALRLIREWAALHRPEIEADWQRAKEGRPLESIEPLQ